MHLRLVFDVELDWEIGKPGAQVPLVRGLAFRRQIGGVEIDEIGVLDAKPGGAAAGQVPHGLRNAAGDKPAIGQANLVKPLQYLPEPRVMPKLGLETCDQDCPHHQPAAARLPT